MEVRKPRSHFLLSGSPEKRLALPFVHSLAPGDSPAPTPFAERTRRVSGLQSLRILLGGLKIGDLHGGPRPHPARGALKSLGRLPNKSFRWKGQALSTGKKSCLWRGPWTGAGRVSPTSEQVPRSRLRPGSGFPRGPQVPSHRAGSLPEPLPGLLRHSLPPIRPLAWRTPAKPA